MGVANPRLVAPGDPDRSILYRRLIVRGLNQMPPTSTNRIDQRGAELVAEWIRSLETESNLAAKAPGGRLSSRPLGTAAFQPSGAAASLPPNGKGDVQESFWRVVISNGAPGQINAAAKGMSRRLSPHQSTAATFLRGSNEPWRPSQEKHH